ncbi:MAG: Uma2 family endonuclease [Candidatus Rokubacteria bacterium]|nr:Uma2 family endonuclease [Candidatus Rokubacteria bacterium]
MAQIPTSSLRRWKRAEYDRLVDLGAFEGDRVELIDGYLVVGEPKGSRHATAVGLVADALRVRLTAGWSLRLQDPIALDERSEPEPDVAVVPGDRRDYVRGHPERAALIVEIAESSLDFDRHHKGSLYARAGLADYWIVNLVDEQLEVYRAPVVDPSATYGWRYGSVERLVPPSAITPLAFPEFSLPIADLLP